MIAIIGVRTDTEKRREVGDVVVKIVSVFNVFNVSNFRELVLREYLEQQARRYCQPKPCLFLVIT